jgi:hypothetical protein
VFNRLAEQLAKYGLCPSAPSIKLCLAAGHFCSENDRTLLAEYFKSKQWELFDDIWLKTRLLALAKSGYMDEIVAVIVKMLVR